MFAGRQQYRCLTCGTQIPPYQSYCDRHLDDAERREQRERPLLLDRFMRRLLGR